MQPHSCGLCTGICDKTFLLIIVCLITREYMLVLLHGAVTGPVFNGRLQTRPNIVQGYLTLYRVWLRISNKLFPRLKYLSIYSTAFTYNCISQIIIFPVITKDGIKISCEGFRFVSFPRCFCRNKNKL